MIKRILGVFSANAFGQLMNVVLRLVSISVFLNYWGKESYGEWLILLTIPSYLALSGTGISTVAANEMAIKNSQGLEKLSLRIFQSIWAFVSVISIVFFIGCVIVALTCPIQNWLSINRTPVNHVSIALILLALYTIFLLQCELLVGVYRASGIFARGIFSNNLVSIFENVGVLIVAILSRDILLAVTVYVLIRISGTFIMAAVILKKAKWFHFGFRHASLSIVRSTLLPTISFVAINVSNAFVVQGIIMVIGITLGASAVVGFTVIRTIINLVKQLNGMIYYSISPEFSTSLAVGNKELAKKLHRFACQVSLIFTVSIIILLLIFGEYIIEVWTKGKVEMDYMFFVLMLLSMLPNTFYVTSSYLHVAINKMGKISLLCIITSTLFLGAAYVTLPLLGLKAIPAIQILIDSVMLIIIVRDSLILLQDNPYKFIQSMFAFGHIKNLRKAMVHSS